MKLGQAVAAASPKKSVTSPEKKAFQSDIAAVAKTVEAFMKKHKKRYSGDKSFEDFTDDLLVAMLKE